MKHTDMTPREREAKRKREAYKPKKRLSATEKRELIQLGKADRMKQKQIAIQLNIGLRTVQRYW